MITDLVIKDCDKRFAQMVYSLHKAYAKRLRFNFEANFSGDVSEFKYFFSKMNPEDLYNIIKEASETK